MKKIALTLATAVALTGCATVFDGGSKTINLIPTNGKDVRVSVRSDGGVQETNIPGIINVKRSKDDLYVTVIDKCYEGSHVIQHEVTPAFFGNILFGIFGLTGTTVDMSSGNMWKYDNTVTIATSKKDSCK